VSNTISIATFHTHQTKQDKLTNTRRPYMSFNVNSVSAHV